ncbi:MAG: hydroxymethylbilane synthase [Helicobacteraceae bacterium]|jgi:hydroxymethylbilane synthase|nr:hydroxymethylbilane synthase [Helicobacteraceae bacterium]
MNKVTIASRGSELALWQANYVAERLKTAHRDLEVDIKIFKTQGDIILDTPLSKIGGKGLFVKELEEAILRGEAHLAVHSLKDLPTRLPSGLVLAGVTERADRRDCLVSEKYDSLDSLPQGALIGTTSLRRRMQLLAMRGDLIIRSLRGNVHSRLDKLRSGLFDAIILARAGLDRLRLTNSVKFVSPFDIEVMLPAMGQGVLGLECAANSETLELITPLIDDTATIESAIERDFVDKLQSGCQAPIGVVAKLFNDGSIYARGVVGLPNAKEILRAEIRGDRSNYAALGGALADQLLDVGAKEVLLRAEAMNNAEK